MDTDTKPKWDALNAVIEKLVIPAGYTGELLTDEHDRLGYRVKNATEDITFWIDGDGTTTFDTAQGRRTFDRRGIESSFYWKPLYDGDERDPMAVIPEQLARVAERRAAFVGTVRIPGLPGGHVISPGELTKLRTELNSGGQRSFAPAGMGTGYTVTAKRSRWSKPASKELAAFLDVRRPVYVETYDAD